MGETERGAPDLFLAHCRKLERLPEDWRIYLWRADESAGGRVFFRLTGVACREVYKSGPRKGEPNYRKRDRSTEREFVIPEREHDAFVAAWEKETGLCRNCNGSGEELAGAGINGAHYRPCARCGRKPAERKP